MNACSIRQCLSLMLPIVDSPLVVLHLVLSTAQPFIAKGFYDEQSVIGRINIKGGLPWFDEITCHTKHQQQSKEESELNGH